MQFITTIRFKIFFILFMGIVPSLVFFYAIVSRNYYLALVSFTISSVDFIHRYVSKEQANFSPAESVINSLTRRVSEILFILSFGFAGLARWNLVAVIALSTVFVSYFRSTLLQFNKGMVLSKDTDSQHIGKIMIIVLAFVLFFFFPNIKFSTYTLSEVTLTTLLIYSVLYIIWDFYRFLSVWVSNRVGKR